MSSPQIESYLTLAGPAEAQIVDRRSRFIAQLSPLLHEQEVQVLVAAQRRAHHGARHWCSAYILGIDGSYARVSDDGEPSGSAGRPILNALRSAGVTNVLGIVVRYFGGIKLGVPGLIAAYRGATEAALAVAEVVQRPVLGRLHLHFSYERQHEVMRIVKGTGGSVESTTYTTDCQCVAQWPIARYAEAQWRLGFVSSVISLPTPQPYGVGANVVSGGE